MRKEICLAFLISDLGSSPFNLSCGHLQAFCAVRLKAAVGSNKLRRATACRKSRVDMNSLRATKFYKQATCPTSEMLLSYHVLASTEQHKRVAAHLATCDFCSAELQLLTEHPPCEDVDLFTEEALMPLTLRRLAEAILAGHPINAATSFLAGATYDKAALTLTDA